MKYSKLRNVAAAAVATAMTAALPAHAQTMDATEWGGGSVIDLGHVPGATSSAAYHINNSGEAVGQSTVGGLSVATSWIGGAPHDLGRLSGSAESFATALNSAGQIVGASVVAGTTFYATEWKDCQIINLGGPAETSSVAWDINDSGLVAGYSYNRQNGAVYATEWTGGSVVQLPSLAGSTSSMASAINNLGQMVGWSSDGVQQYATEWSGGSVVNLGVLPGTLSSVATGINDLGKVVGDSCSATGCYATLWSGGQVINLGPGHTYGINNAGQVAGQTLDGDDGIGSPTLWSNDSAVSLSGPTGAPGWEGNAGYGLNDLGQVVGANNGQLASAVSWDEVSSAVPEPSTWAMMLLGFAGLASAIRGRTQRLSSKASWG
jgi:probable HAF family extracellular repeat protein